MPSLPFDIAVMEKTARGAVVPVDLDRTDLGDWDAIQSVLSADGAGNTLAGDVMAFDTKNSDGPLIATVGLDDVVVDRLRCEERPEADIRTSVHRPWGSYRSLALNERFQVKEFVVRPGAQLSLQLHRHRSEHWVVVNWAALVTIGNEEKIVHENESI